MEYLLVGISIIASGCISWALSEVYHHRQTKEMRSDRKALIGLLLGFRDDVQQAQVAGAEVAVVSDSAEATVRGEPTPAKQLPMTVEEFDERAKKAGVDLLLLLNPHMRRPRTPP